MLTYSILAYAYDPRAMSKSNVDEESTGQRVGERERAVSGVRCGRDKCRHPRASPRK